MNGFKNETTYLAFIWLSNDRLLHDQINGKSGVEIKAFVQGLSNVAKASSCECLVDFTSAYESLGNSNLIDWDEISKTLLERK